MYQQSNIFPIAEFASYFGPATVLEDENSDGKVDVRWFQDGKAMLATVVIAFPREHLIARQANLLVAGNDVDSMFAIGLLDTVPSLKVVTNETIKSSHGAFAQLNKTKSEEFIEVYSERKELLFKYDPINQISQVNIPIGDLELNSKQGNIRLNAGKTVEINGDTLSLNSKKLSIKALVGEMFLGRLETTTETLIENAKNVYRSVKELSQLRSGRVRTLVDETYQLNANKVLTKSETDFKVKAEKIHLG